MVADKRGKPASIRRAHWTFRSDDAVAAQAVRHSFVAYAVGGVDITKPLDTTAAELVIGELVGNVERHAPGVVGVFADWKSDEIIIDVTNEGEAFALDVNGPDTMFSESGRGLLIVRAYASDLKIVADEPGICRVRAVIPLASCA